MTASLFNAQSFRQSSFIDKIDGYFQDYSMMPLMIQENYIKMKPMFCQESGLGGKKLVANHLDFLAKAADSISRGNLVETLAQRENNWSLMPVHAVISTVTPCFWTHGHASGMYNFSGWLGQNSKQTKTTRMLREVQNHMRIKTSGDKSQIRLNYLPILAPLLTKPMIEDESGIEKVIDVMDAYYLTRDDWDSILELGYQSLSSGIPTKTKSAFTRTYNKMSHISPFEQDGTGKKPKAKAPAREDAPDLEEVIDLDDEAFEESEEETTPAVAKKEKKPTAKKKPAAKKPSTKKK